MNNFPSGFRLAALVVACLLWAPGALADIFKCVDSSGHVTYSNVVVKGCKKLNLEPPPTSAASKAAKAQQASPGNFPKVNVDTQRSRDDMRRRILEQELAAETDQLAKAKLELAEGESTRNADERNYTKYLDRVQKLRDNVELHAKNVEAISKELANLH